MAQERVRRPGVTQSRGSRLWWLLLVLLAGCASTPPAPLAGPDAGTSAEAFYANPPVAGQVLRIDAATSRLDVMVFRAGKLAARGHNHVLRAAELQGAVFLPATGMAAARLDLQVPVAALQVDPAQARQDAGPAFAAEVSARAREGTRANMLGDALLQARDFPLVHVQARVQGGELPWLVLDCTIQVRAHRHRVSVPVHATVSDGALRARGTIVLQHAELGLEPFTALGGLIQVAAPVVVDFDLRAIPST